MKLALATTVAASISSLNDASNKNNFSELDHLLTTAEYLNNDLAEQTIRNAFK